MDASRPRRSLQLRHTQWAATTRLVASAVVGTVVWLLADLTAGTAIAMLTALAAFAAVFDLSALAALGPMDAASTRANARREALQPLVEEVVIVVVALASLGGIGALMILDDSQTRNAAAAIGLVGVFTTWSMLHLMYAARYANLYYLDGEHGGGIDFNTTEPPSYRDFFYFSYTIGMTYAVSDCNIATRQLRIVALRHGILSYLFGTVILAATINLVAGIIT
ncbi:MAG: DUF1345 domain-containing protein [Nocardioides sp.]|uniref:DUF1345 domain-containing protein n=1 Tax=Nocardioides sp. TaxID=35761 RepID=UPI0039E69498